MVRLDDFFNNLRSYGRSAGEELWPHHSVPCAAAATAARPVIRLVISIPARVGSSAAGLLVERAFAFSRWNPVHIHHGTAKKPSKPSLKHRTQCCAPSCPEGSRS